MALISYLVGPSSPSRRNEVSGAFVVRYPWRESKILVVQAVLVSRPELSPESARTRLELGVHARQFDGFEPLVEALG